MARDDYNNTNNHLAIHTENIGNSPRQKYLINYNPIFDEYFIKLSSGTKQCIKYCPYCGFKLPESKRDLWYEEIEKLGIDANIIEIFKDARIPDKYHSSKWWHEK